MTKTTTAHLQSGRILTPFGLRARILLNLLSTRSMGVHEFCQVNRPLNVDTWRGDRHWGGERRNFGRYVTHENRNEAFSKILITSPKEVSLICNIFVRPGCAF